MEEPIPPQLPKTPNPPAMSLPARLFNIWAAPGDVFDEIKSAKPATANWLVPVLLSCVVGMISVLVIFSQPGVLQQMKEKQEEQLDKLVASGKLNAEAKTKAQEGIESFGMTVIKISGAIGAVVASFAWVLVAAAVLKLLGSSMLKAAFSFSKALEVAGLAAMVSLLGGIIQTLLVVATGSMFVSAGPALLISNFNPANKTHLLMGTINVMTLWYLAVLGLGLAKISGTTAAKPVLCLVALWLVLRAGIIFSGLGASGM